MKYLGWSLVLLIAMRGTVALGFAPPVTQATESMIEAVTAPRVWAQWDTLQPPSLTEEVRRGIATELWNNSAVQDSYSHLAATEKPHGMLRAIEELEEAKAVWCLTSGLCHPNGEVRIRCAKALLRINKNSPAQFVLEVADAFSVSLTSGEQADTLASFQHALCTLLNNMTGLSVSLHGGQDPEGLLAALPKWKKALRDRAGPIVRNEKERRVIDEARNRFENFSLTATIAPRPQGLWDPAFEVASVTLTGGMPPEQTDVLADKPIHATAQLTRDQMEILLCALADDGFFTQAKTTDEPRSDRHCRVEVTISDEAGSARYIVDYDWKPSMAQALEAIRCAVDGKPGKLMTRLMAPLAEQRAEWSRQAATTAKP